MKEIVVEPGRPKVPENKGFIICTGMDNTGKTTLVEEISAKLYIDLFKSPGPEETKDYMSKWSKLIMENSYPVICDRFPLLEEQVYGPILRNHTNFTFNCPEMEIFKQRSPLIIYTRPPKEAIFNWGDRPQMKGVKSEAPYLLRAYDHLMLELMAINLPIIVYNYLAHDKETLLNMCTDYLVSRYNYKEEV